MLSLKSQPSLLKNRWLWGILLIAFFLRLGAAVYWHRSANAENGYFRLGDSDGYWVLATHLANGEPYQYGSENASVFRAPLMPLFLSAFTCIDDRYTAILAARLAGAALGTIAVLLIALLAGRVSWLTQRDQTLPALLAALIAAVHPSAIGMSIVVLSEMVFVPLMLVYLLLWSRWLPEVLGFHRNQDTQNSSNSNTRSNSNVLFTRQGLATLALLTGVVGGLATLARPSWLLFSPFVLVVGLCCVKNRAAYLKSMMLVAVGMSVAMMPWWIRNYSVTGKFVLTTLQVGPSLYDSFHPGASGGSDEGMRFMRQIEADQFSEDDVSRLANPNQSLDGTFEWRINRRAQQMAVRWCWQNPSEVARLAWAKFCKTWNVWPDGGEVGSPIIRLAVSVGTLGVILLAVYGSLSIYRTNPVLLAICWSPCLYFTLLHMVFVGSVRYREPAIVVLIAVAGCALAKTFSRTDLSTEDCSRVSSTLPDRSTG